MHKVVRLLLVVLVAIQFAGILAPPFAKAQTEPSGLRTHGLHQHVHGTGEAGADHKDEQKSSTSEHCCALHATLVGILCNAFVIESSAAPCTRVVAAVDLGRHASLVNRLDRPPRPIT